MTPDWCEDKKSPSVDQEGFHISTNFQDPCHTNSDVIKSAEGQKHLKAFKTNYRRFTWT